MVAALVNILTALSMSSIHHSTAFPSRFQPICASSAAESASQQHHLRFSSVPHHTIFLPNSPAVCTPAPFHHSCFNHHIPTTANLASIARVRVINNPSAISSPFSSFFPVSFAFKRVERCCNRLFFTFKYFSRYSAPYATNSRPCQPPQPSSCLLSASPSAYAFPLSSPFFTIISTPNIFS